MSHPVRAMSQPVRVMSQPDKRLPRLPPHTTTFSIIGTVSKHEDLSALLLWVRVCGMTYTAILIVYKLVEL